MLMQQHLQMLLDTSQPLQSCFKVGMLDTSQPLQCANTYPSPGPMVSETTVISRNTKLTDGSA